MRELTSTVTRSDQQSTPSLPISSSSASSSLPRGLFSSDPGSTQHAHQQNPHHYQYGQLQSQGQGLGLRNSAGNLRSSFQRAYSEEMDMDLILDRMSSSRFSIDGVTGGGSSFYGKGESARFSIDSAVGDNAMVQVQAQAEVNKGTSAQRGPGSDPTKHSPRTRPLKEPVDHLCTTPAPVQHSSPNISGAVNVDQMLECLDSLDEELRHQSDHDDDDDDDDNVPTYHHEDHGDGDDGDAVCDINDIACDRHRFQMISTQQQPASMAASMSLSSLPRQSIARQLNASGGRNITNIDTNNEGRRGGILSPLPLNFGLLTKQTTVNLAGTDASLENPLHQVQHVQLRPGDGDGDGEAEGEGNGDGEAEGEREGGLGRGGRVKDQGPGTVHEDEDGRVEGGRDTLYDGRTVWEDIGGSTRSLCSLLDVSPTCSPSHSPSKVSSLSSRFAESSSTSSTSSSTSAGKLISRASGFGDFRQPHSVLSMKNRLKQAFSSGGKLDHATHAHTPSPRNSTLQTVP